MATDINASLAAVLQHIDSHHDQSVTQLCEFLKFPSVSADPNRAADVKACADWLANKISASGLSAEVIPTPGHPIVLARNQHIPGRPTVLLYGHYDVQPPDPLAQWITPPFEPTVRKTPANTDAIYARGAADDKGQIWAHLAAISAWQSIAGRLPINLIALFEGEEEIDSHHLPAFLDAQRDKLQADIAVISDTNGFARGIPAITTGLRGLVYSEITLRSSTSDLHSGIHGGAVLNPAIALSKILAKLHDHSGKVMLENFYDNVELPTESERKDWANLPFDEKSYASSLDLWRGETTLGGETGYTTLQRKWSRPTCDICGLTSGYQGPGSKTIIPASASAKISFRLVPRQDPFQVREMLEKFVSDQTPPGLETKITHYAAAPAVLLDQNSQWLTAATAAITHGFGRPPVLIREGLTIPIVNLLKQKLNLQTLLVGFGLPDDNPHAPNEKFDLESLKAGTRTAAVLYASFAKLAR
jgi:acetylornithine deacetylase/succinyl-diaminopimelate desuccinylase-like protein